MSPAERLGRIRELVATGVSNREIGRRLQMPEVSVRRARATLTSEEVTNMAPVATDATDEVPDWRQQPQVKQAAEELEVLLLRVRQLQADLADAKDDVERLARHRDAGDPKRVAAQTRVEHLELSLAEARALLDARPQAHGLTAMHRSMQLAPSRPLDPLNILPEPVAEGLAAYVDRKGCTCQCGATFPDVPSYEQHIRDTASDTTSAQGRLEAAQADARSQAEQALRKRYAPLVKELGEALDKAVRASQKLRSVEREYDRQGLPHPDLSLSRAGRTAVLDSQDEYSVVNAWKRRCREQGF